MNVFRIKPSSLILLIIINVIFISSTILMIISTIKLNIYLNNSIEANTRLKIIFIILIMNDIFCILGHILLLFSNSIYSFFCENMKDSIILNQTYDSERDKSGWDKYTLMQDYSKYKIKLFEIIVICNNLGIILYTLHILIISFCALYFYKIGELKDHDVRMDIAKSTIISYITFILNIIRYIQILMFTKNLSDLKHPMDEYISENDIMLTINS